MNPPVPKGDLYYMTMPRSCTLTAVAFACLLAAALLLAPGCSATYPNRNPVGETFPSVAGQSLEEERVELPGALAGEPAIILVGYKQRSQFDIDRWIMGLIQADAPGRIIELPTIPGLVPSAFSGWIDDGMRAGIPEEDWGVVVTLYGSAATPVAKLTGNIGSNARVLVLDPDGEIVWFADRGYSATQALEAARITRALAPSE